MSLPPLHKFVLEQLPEVPQEPFQAKGPANKLVIDGAALASILYPPPLDCSLPQWKELHSRVQLFVEHLIALGFCPIVFFGAPKSEHQNVEAKKRLLLERSKFVQGSINAISCGARLPEDVYYTPIRLIKCALVKAFQSLEGVTVIITDADVPRAVSIYCAGKEEEIFGVMGADVSEALLFPIHALFSVHPAIFDWEAFWKGMPPKVLVIRRDQVHQALVPQCALPVFGTLVGNPLFPRSRLEGFFINESSPAEIFTAAKVFISQVLEEEAMPSTDIFAQKVFSVLTNSHDYDAFVADFSRSCTAYTIANGEKLQESPFETLNKSRVYFFEPGLEYPDFMPAMLLLRPLRLQTLNLKFGALTFAEIWAMPGGTFSTDYLSLPAPAYTAEEVLQKSVLERLQLFEMISAVELSPVMVFDENYELNQGNQMAVNECWLYLTTSFMGQLDGRVCFYRRDELQLLVAQFVTLSDTETHLLPKGALTVERAALCHLFHATLSHLSRLNMVCGSPFKSYNEWEMFDGSLATLSLDTIMELPAFAKNKERYTVLMDMIEKNLPHPLADEPSPGPSEAQLRRPRAEMTFAAQYREAATSLHNLLSPSLTSPVVVRVNCTAASRACSFGNGKCPEAHHNSDCSPEAKETAVHTIKKAEKAPTLSPPAKPMNAPAIPEAAQPCAPNAHVPEDKGATNGANLEEISTTEPAVKCESQEMHPKEKKASEVPKPLRPKGTTEKRKWVPKVVGE